jgi:hypothetical protein
MGGRFKEEGQTKSGKKSNKKTSQYGRIRNNQVGTYAKFLSNYDK